MEALGDERHGGGRRRPDTVPYIADDEVQVIEFCVKTIVGIVKLRFRVALVEGVPVTERSAMSRLQHTFFLRLSIQTLDIGIT